jgi:hypothetical protein
MSDKTKFERHSSFPQANCYYLESGWFWKMDIPRFDFSKLNLVDAAGMYVSSNAGDFVSNRDDNLTNRRSTSPNRTIELLGLQVGIAMIEVREGGEGGKIVMTMQVEVKDLPTGQATFLQLPRNSAAINAADTPVPYSLTTTTRITHSDPLKLFETVPARTSHVVLSCHGQMKATGVKLLIAGGVGRDNAERVFATLKSKMADGVIWIGGCTAGADNEFCGIAARASGCYVVAPGLTIPAIKARPGMIELWSGQLPKVFDKKTGNTMKLHEFMDLQRTLNFSHTAG